MPASRHRSLSPITEKKPKRHTLECDLGMKRIRTCVCSQRNYGCWGEVIVHLVGADQFRRLHTAHERHRNIHLRHVSAVMSADFLSGRWGRHTHEDDVKRPIPLYACLERVYCK